MDDSSHIVLGPLPLLHLGSVQLPTYYVWISLLLTGLVIYSLRRADRLDFSGPTAIDLFLVALGSGALGARLLHIIYEAPTYYLDNPLAVFYFWQGGFVFYGGLLGGLLGGWIALQIKKQSFWRWLDFFTPVLSVGYALGRIACFLTGCCYGKVCEGFLGYTFLQIHNLSGTVTEVSRYPTQLFASGLEFLIFAALIYFEKKRFFWKSPGALFLVWLWLHSLARIGIEFLRDDDRGAQWGPVSVSMGLSLVLIALASVSLWQRRGTITLTSRNSK